MEECLNRSCPCLRSLWDRVFTSEKKTDELERKASNSSHFKPDSNPDSDQRYKTSPRAHTLPQPVAPEDSAVYTAVWAFEARDTDELSFDAGDRFHVVARAGDWWTASKLDASGLVLATGIVPHNYLERADSVKSQPWVLSVYICIPVYYPFPSFMC